MEIPVHIFIVENGNLFAGMLEYIFTKDYKYKFMDFKTGEECISNLKFDPDIIVLDDDLPGIDGFNTLLQIKKNKPGTKVILMLGKNNEKHPSAFIDAGADDFLLKDERVVEKVIEKLESFFTVAEAEHLPGAKRRKKPSIKELQFSD